ncbi:MAG: acetyl-CoA carboxylase carboxyltransferase subunit beta [Alphaproteobacteria bacterium]|nr:acetyl-CoA carboxylase carboxyltransferase subunit beta [Alphaproteobacteria bacterium]
MNWLSNLIPPKIRSFVSEQKDVPDNLWQKCDRCEGMLFHRDLAKNHNVCYHCGNHLRLSVKDRLEMLFDDGEYKTHELPQVPQDPLKFKDRKRYSERIKEAQSKTGLKDAITIASGKMGGIKVVVAAFNFRYMGGSMGIAVGESIVKAAEIAVREKAAFITVPASGGARMQEGMLSLMQMPRTIIAVEMVKAAKLPYIVILTDPTTGGVSASFAMVGDIHIAEPGTMIGFAGRRVIEETVRETLPENFQTAEHLLEHGMVDMVVKREDMRDMLINIMSILMKKSRPEKPNGSKNKNSNSKADAASLKNSASSDIGKEATTRAKAAQKAVTKIKQNAQDVTGQTKSKAAKK